MSSEYQVKPCVCPFCDAETKPAFPFCQACGKNLRFCVACGQPLPEAAHYCLHCGSPQD